MNQYFRFKILFLKMGCFFNLFLGKIIFIGCNHPFCFIIIESADNGNNPASESGNRFVYAENVNILRLTVGSIHLDRKSTRLNSSHRL